MGKAIPLLRSKTRLEELIPGFDVLVLQTSDQSTAFHDACSLGPLDVVELLAFYDPEVTSLDLVDNQGTTPLHRAAKSENTAIVAFLLDGVCNVI